MKKLMMAVCFVFAAHTAQAQIASGTAAPDFKAVDSISGKEFSLSDYKGKTVVLEWVNFGCPFVKKHYGSSNMQNLQKQAAKDGVIWISVNSAAEGKQGYIATDETVRKELKDHNAVPARFVRDTSGSIGKAYGAKTTPHMFIVDAEGTLVYQGAIDDKASVDIADVAKAINYVNTALVELKAGKKVHTATTTPYGCGVKYAD